MRRSTLVFVLLFLAMVGAYYYFKNREQPAADTADIALTVEPAPESAYLFEAADGVPNRIRLEANTGEVVELARNADAENAWVVVEPIEAAADQGSAEAAASQITTMSILNTIPDLDPKEVGLDVPQYELTVTFAGDVERIAGIGVLTPTESGYYALKDGEIVIVSRSGIDTLINLLTNPPYAETPTPTPIPPTATATPLPSSTPEPGTPVGENPTPTP